MGSVLPQTSLGHESLLVPFLQSVMTSKYFLVCVKQQDMIGGPESPNTVMFKRFACVEVKHEQDRSLLVDDELVLLMTECKELVLCRHYTKD